MFPDGSTAMLTGRFRVALVAGPPSPEKLPVPVLFPIPAPKPVPATVVMIPLVSTLRMTLFPNSDSTYFRKHLFPPARECAASRRRPVRRPRGITGLAITGYGRDDSVEGQFSNPVVDRIGQVDCLPRPGSRAKACSVEPLFP